MLIHGNNLDELPKLSDASIDAIITDPPYELGFMGKSWDSTGIAYNIQLWQQCLRVLKPGGHVLAFGGSRTYHRMAVAIEDAGFDIRDQIMWVYGSGFPKSLNVGKQAGCEEWDGWGTALKPAHEPIVLARKPLDGTVANNVLQYGTGALNIDGCRVGSSKPPTSLHSFTALRRMEGRDDLQEPTGDDRTNVGRWPANLIHDGSDEVLELFPDTTRDLAARFFYCAKANKRDRNEGLDNFPADKPVFGDEGGTYQGLSDSKNPQANQHPTVKPTDLMRYLCRLITPPRGTILDPFTGSGSTGKAAILEGFNFIGIEIDADYIKIAEARIDYAYTQRH